MAFGLCPWLGCLMCPELGIKHFKQFFLNLDQLLQQLLILCRVCQVYLPELVELPYQVLLE